MGIVFINHAVHDRRLVDAVVQALAPLTDGRYDVVTTFDVLASGTHMIERLATSLAQASALTLYTSSYERSDFSQRQAWFSSMRDRSIALAVEPGQAAAISSTNAGTRGQLFHANDLDSLFTLLGDEDRRAAWEAAKQGLLARRDELSTPPLTREEHERIEDEHGVYDFERRTWDRAMQVRARLFPAFR